MKESQKEKLLQWLEQVGVGNNDVTERLLSGAVGMDVDDEGNSGVRMSALFRQKCQPDFHRMAEEANDKCAVPMNREQLKAVREQLEEIYNMVVFMMVIRNQCEFHDEFNPDEEK